MRERTKEKTKTGGIKNDSKEWTCRDGKKRKKLEDADKIVAGNQGQNDGTVLAARAGAGRHKVVGLLPEPPLEIALPKFQVLAPPRRQSEAAVGFNGLLGRQS